MVGRDLSESVRDVLLFVFFAAGTCLDPTMLAPNKLAHVGTDTDFDSALIGRLQIAQSCGQTHSTYSSTIPSKGGAGEPLIRTRSSRDVPHRRP